MIKAAIVDDDLEFLEVMAHELEKTMVFTEIKTSNDPQQFLVSENLREGFRNRDETW